MGRTDFVTVNVSTLGTTTAYGTVSGYRAAYENAERSIGTAERRPVDAWKRGGCIVCGGKDRGAHNGLAHSECFNGLSEEQLIELNQFVTPLVSDALRFSLAMPEVDRALRFLAGLNLQDHPKRVYEEQREIVRALSRALGKTK